MGVAAERRARDLQPPAVYLAPASPSHPWERQPGESQQAYARFLTYRNTPPGERALRRVGVSQQLASRWSSRWKWLSRCAAFDDWLFSANDALALRGVLTARMRGVRVGSELTEKASAALVTLKNDKLDASDVVLLAKTGIEIEREALGLDKASSDGGNNRGGTTVVLWGQGVPAPVWLGKQNGPELELNKTPTVLLDKGNQNDNSGEPNTLVCVGEQVLAGTGSGAACEHSSTTTLQVDCQEDNG
jgi:hypothetical protein